MDKKRKASLAWQALTAILALKKEANVEDINEHLEKTPEPHVMAVQFILLGSGCATEELEPDGVYGAQSFASIQCLYMEAHYL
jgi:hypothetical protein